MERNAIRWLLTFFSLVMVGPRVFLWSMATRQQMVYDALNASGASSSDVARDPFAGAVTFVVSPELTTVAMTSAALVWTGTAGAVAVAIAVRRMVWFWGMRRVGPEARHFSDRFACVMLRAGTAVVTLMPVVAVVAWSEIRATALLDAAAACGCPLNTLTAPLADTASQRAAQGMQHAWAARHLILSITTLEVMVLLWHRAGVYASRLRFEWQQRALESPNVVEIQ
jgi:hypothetical protein